MNHDLTPKQRKELEGKMANVLEDDVRELSEKYQRILVDDMVTAFENRMKVLIRAQKKGIY